MIKRGERLVGYCCFALQFPFLTLLLTVKLKLKFQREILCGAVTFGYGLLVVVHTERDTLVLHLFDFKACENLLEVPDDVWEGWAEFGVHLGGGKN